MLEGMGVLTRADGLALESLCEAVADLRTAREALAIRGDVSYAVVTENGVIRRPQPEVAMIGDADRRVRAWCAAFGLTPADRVRVARAICKGDDADPAERYFRRPAEPVRRGHNECFPKN
jgi:P27 family predicted phage terminase small subunit